MSRFSAASATRSWKRGDLQHAASDAAGSGAGVAICRRGLRSAAAAEPRGAARCAASRLAAPRRTRRPTTSTALLRAPMPTDGRTAAILVEHPQRLVRRRQVGGIGEAHQHHFGGGERPRGACTSAMPFNSICQARDSTRIDSLVGEVARAQPLGLAERDIVGDRGTIFSRVTKWTNSARSVSTTDRVGAGIVLVAQFAEAPRRRRRASAPRTGR